VHACDEEPWHAWIVVWCAAQYGMDCGLLRRAPQDHSRTDGERGTISATLQGGHRIIVWRGARVRANVPNKISTNSFDAA
jgi:hypothetical protein